MSLKPCKVDFNPCWNRVKEVCESVVSMKNVSQDDWSNCFHVIYKLCVSLPDSFSDPLYRNVKIFLKNHVRLLYQKISNFANDRDSFMNNYYNNWLIYRDGVKHLDALFGYLNKMHAKYRKYPDFETVIVNADSVMLKIGDLGLYFWKTEMIEPLSQALVFYALNSIRDDRLNKETNGPVVQGVILSLVAVDEYKNKGSLDLYQELFEKPFLETTANFYSNEAKKLLDECDCSQYMEKVIQRLIAEDTRCRKYLHISSLLKVIKVCEEKLISDHLAFLHSECKEMIVSQNKKDLNNLFKLLRATERGLQFLIDELQEYFTKKGLDVINSISGQNVPNIYVENLLEVHRKSLNLINEVFYGDQQFVGALDRAFSTVLNFPRDSKSPRSSELLARYCDSLLKKSARSLGENEADEKLNASITIFKYIQDKDVFQKFFTRMLAKRLIHSQSLSMDCEEAMINRLKRACGHDFTFKLHRMLTDVKVSNDLNQNFSDWCKSNSKELDGINFNIFVVQAGAWPLTQNVSTFSIPLTLEKSVTCFESFYNSLFNGRKLTFLHHLSTCEVKISLTKRSYIALMDTYYMAILSHYESCDSLTLRDIQMSTNLTKDQLTKHLMGLLSVKLLINRDFDDAARMNELISSDKIFDQDASFKINLNFSSKRTKFKILAVSPKENIQNEAYQINLSIEEDRKLFLQAAIARIMKARRVIKHNQLVQEVIEQSKDRFYPSAQMIKKCIESLLDRQYLERTSNNDEYSYIA